MNNLLNRKFPVLHVRFWPKADINQTAKGEIWLESQNNHSLMSANDPKRTFIINCQSYPKALTMEAGSSSYIS